jgi:ABC-type oligopeptide transport system ATPase subunit
MTTVPTMVLEVRDLKKHFPVRRGFFGRQIGTVRAVDGIAFALRSGETLGLVGESGYGKSTTGKMISKLIEPTAGIYLNGERIEGLSRRAMRPRRRCLQVVFQHPYSADAPIAAWPFRCLSLAFWRRRITGGGTPRWSNRHTDPAWKDTKGVRQRPVRSPHRHVAGPVQHG